MVHNQYPRAEIRITACDNEGIISTSALIVKLTSWPEPILCVLRDQSSPPEAGRGAMERRPHLQRDVQMHCAVRSFEPITHRRSECPKDIASVPLNIFRH